MFKLCVALHQTSSFRHLFIRNDLSRPVVAAQDRPRERWRAIHRSEDTRREDLKIPRDILFDFGNDVMPEPEPSLYSVSLLTMTKLQCSSLSMSWRLSSIWTEIQRRKRCSSFITTELRCAGFMSTRWRRRRLQMSWRLRANIIILSDAPSKKLFGYLSRSSILTNVRFGS